MQALQLPPESSSKLHPSPAATTALGVHLLPANPWPTNEHPTSWQPPESSVSTEDKKLLRPLA